MKLNIFSSFLNENICSIIYNLYKIKINGHKYEKIFSHLQKNDNQDYDNIIFIEKKYLNEPTFKNLVQLINKNKSTNLIIPFDLEISNVPSVFIKNECDLWKKDLIKKNMIINFDEIVKNFNNNYISWRKWYLSKSPFTAEFEIFLSKKIFETIKVIKGERKKAIFIDLDDTIWGGTLAEEKYYNLKIGGIDPLGEAFLDFQKLLKKYSDTGIILGIISRNFEKDALIAIKKHPEMHLKIDDFSGWKINHNKKSQNIIELAKEIKIGTDSIVFLDNSYYERIEVKNNIKDITVPELDDPYNYCSILKNTTSLSYTNLTNEDLVRGKQYQQIQKINDKKKNYNSHSEWVKSIGTQITFKRFSILNLERYFQMFNKINQLNLSSRRLNRDNIKKISMKKSNFFFSISQQDKYVDLGIIGIIIYRKTNYHVTVTDFLFSCRALGRGTEKLVLQFIINKIFKKWKIKEIYFNYKKTEKNILMRNLLEELKVSKKNFSLKNKRKLDIENSVKIIVTS
jgi:FkbH-like protein